LTRAALAASLRLRRSVREGREQPPSRAAFLLPSDIAFFAFVLPAPCRGNGRGCRADQGPALSSAGAYLCSLYYPGRDVKEDLGGKFTKPPRGLDGFRHAPGSRVRRRSCSTTPDIQGKLRVAFTRWRSSAAKFLTATSDAASAPLTGGRRNSCA
jgi:hypothetical protein